MSEQTNQNAFPLIIKISKNHQLLLVKTPSDILAYEPFIVIALNSNEKELQLAKKCLELGMQIGPATQDQK